MTSDGFYDTAFDDGVQVKAEVLEWLRRLSLKHYGADAVQTVIAQMMARSAQRPSTTDIQAQLANIVSPSAISLDPP